jgi:hypothetical protein
VDSEYCRKEGKLAQIEQKLDTVNKIVMGNGKDGLATTVTRLEQTSGRLELAVTNLDRNTGGRLEKLFDKLHRYEGENEGKASMKKSTRWIIGLLVTGLGILTTALIYTIHLLAQQPGGG